MPDDTLQVRPTGILIEDGKILLTRQEVSQTRNWSLPGGKPEFGESIEHCLVREIKEETGLDVKMGELLYVCDRFRHMNGHVIHITFLVERTSGVLKSGGGPQPDGEVIQDVRMVPVDDLPAYGFSRKFHQLVKDNFPGRGGYKGEFHKFYDERA